MTLVLRGHIRNGRLEVDLPEGIDEGAVTVTVEPDEAGMTPDEILEAIRSARSRPGREVVEWLLSDDYDASPWQHITDPLEWVMQQRRDEEQQGSI